MRDFGGGFAPTWNTLADNTINGRVKIDGYNGFWAGLPAPQVGDSEGEPNVVTGNETGQCAGIH